jgi:hypothetical protein
MTARLTALAAILAAALGAANPANGADKLKIVHPRPGTMPTAGSSSGKLVVLCRLTPLDNGPLYDYQVSIDVGGTPQTKPGKPSQQPRVTCFARFDHLPPQQKITITACAILKSDPKIILKAAPVIVIMKKSRPLDKAKGKAVAMKKKNQGRKATPSKRKLTFGCGMEVDWPNPGDMDVGEGTHAFYVHGFWTAAPGSTAGGKYGTSPVSGIGQTPGVDGYDWSVYFDLTDPTTFMSWWGKLLPFQSYCNGALDGLSLTFAVQR